VGSKKLKRPNITKGAIAGAVGGIAGAWTMSRSARLTKRITGAADGASRAELARLEARRFVDGSSQELDSIGAAADWLDSRVFRRRCSPTQRALLAAGVHYATGASFGALYGALAEVAPKTTVGLGVPVAVAESAILESSMSSLLRLGGPRGYRWTDHAQSALDHGVYGATLELVRRTMRQAR